MFFEILLITLVYGALLVLVTYYVNLYINKDQYTKDELKNLSPFLSQLWNLFLNRYSVLSIVAVSIGAAFVGALIPLLSKGWIINSALIFLVVYFAVPLLRQSFEKTQVMTSEEYSDNLANHFVKHSDLGTFAFGAGYGASLFYSWAVHSTIYFIWLLVNVIIITILLVLLLRKEIVEK